MLQPASIFERVHQGMTHLKAVFQNPVQKLNQQSFKGQSLVETSLVMGLVGVVCIGTVATLGGNISSLISEANGSTAPTTALVSSNPNLVNQNLGAPNATTGAGFISGQNPLGTTGGNTQNTVETVTAAGAGLLEGAPDENLIENTNPGGPIGPVLIQPNTNTAGTGAGTPVVKPTLTPQQQFSPEYQAWRNNPNNAKTVAMIDSLSPDGQKIANEVFAFAEGNGTPRNAILELSNQPTKDSDRQIFQQYVNSISASVNE